MQMNKTCLRLAGLLLVGLATAGTPFLNFSKTSAQNIALTVSVDKRQGRISPFVYGANSGPWALVPPDQWPVAKQELRKQCVPKLELGNEGITVAMR